MKIIAVGKNYRDHAIEFDGSNEKPAVPIIFMKPDSAIIKNGKHFYVPDFLGRVDYEAEIVVRINKLGKSIPARSPPVYCMVPGSISMCSSLKSSFSTPESQQMILKIEDPTQSKIKQVI